MKYLLFTFALFISQLSIAQELRLAAGVGVQTNTFKNARTTLAEGLTIGYKIKTIELGISVQSMELKSSSQPGFFRYGEQVFRESVIEHYAKNATPVTAFVNFCGKSKKTYAYAGFNAGLVAFHGGDSTVYDPRNVPKSMDVYCSSSLGYTAGVQFGLRFYVMKHIDAGFQIQGNFLSVKMNDGAADWQQKRFTSFYVPSMVYMGFRF